MDRLAYMNAKAREKGEDYGTFVGKVKQESTWGSVTARREILREEIRLVSWIQERGYKKYKNQTKRNSRSFQKKFGDDKGKKYFINAHLYLTGKEDYELSWEYESCLFSKGSHDPVKMLFYAGWTLEDTEEYLEKLWETGLFEHYEFWN